MSADRDEYLSLRIDPKLKAALRAAAEQEGRSVGNLVKHLIRQYCAGMEGVVRQAPARYRIRKKK